MKWSNNIYRVTLNGKSRRNNKKFIEKRHVLVWTIEHPALERYRNKLSISIFSTDNKLSALLWFWDDHVHRRSRYIYIYNTHDAAHMFIKNLCVFLKCMRCYSHPLCNVYLHRLQTTETANWLTFN